MAKIQFAGKTRNIPLKPDARRLFYYFDQQTHNRTFKDWVLMHDLSMVRQHLMGLFHGVTIPRALLIDPTYACNLSCKGCYAAGYGKDEGLSFEELDRIITEAERLSIHFFLFTGGEPLVRREDLMKLAQKHRFSIFHAFTNGTLIDAAYADQVAAAGNLTFGFSVEGSGKKRISGGGPAPMTRSWPPWTCCGSGRCPSPFPPVTTPSIMKPSPVMPSSTTWWPRAAGQAGISAICPSGRMRPWTWSAVLSSGPMSP